MPNQNTNNFLAPDWTQKTVIPKVRYHPDIQTQATGAKSRNSQTQRTRHGAVHPSETGTERKTLQENQDGDKTSQIIPGPVVWPQPDGARKQSAQKRDKKPVERAATDPDPPRPEEFPLGLRFQLDRSVVEDVEVLTRVIPKVRYHPDIQTQATGAKSRNSQTQRTRHGAVHPSETGTERKTLQENQDGDKTSQIIPGPVVWPQPDGARKQSAQNRDKKPVERAATDPDPPRPEQFPLGLRVQLDRSVVEDVEVLTRGQSTNQEWFAWRKNRITASVAHRIAHCRFVNGKSKTPPTAYLAGITGEQRSFRTRAMTWGVQMESEVVRRYQRLKSAALGRSIFVQDCGLFIDAQHSWLAASPDGIVTDSQTNEWLLCLEVKCPYKHRHRRVEDACRDDPAFCLEIQDEDRREPGGSPVYRLKTSHSYYTQIQVQLAVMGLCRADLAVFTLKETAIVPVTFDPDLWEETVSKLEIFYRNAVLPHLREKTRLDTAAAWTPEL